MIWRPGSGVTQWSGHRRRSMCTSMAQKCRTRQNMCRRPQHKSYCSIGDPIARLNRSFDATHTTSPAGSIMASIDAARALLARDGERLCARLVQVVGVARKQLREVPGVGVLDGPGVDPAKLVVLLAGAGAHGGL